MGWRTSAVTPPGVQPSAHSLGWLSMSMLRVSIRVLASLPLLGLLGCKPSTPSTGPGPEKPPLLVIEDDAPTNESACEDRLSFARETVADVAVRANGECTEDHECALVYIDTMCQGACQAVILESNVEAFEGAKRDIDARVCIDYAQDTCAYSTPRCMQAQAICEQQRCTMIPAASG